MARKMKDFEECEAIAARQIKSGTLSISWIDEDECLYRGHVIRRHDSVPTGYYGRYSVRHSKGQTSSFAKMSQAKGFIDKLVAVVPA